MDKIKVLMIDDNANLCEMVKDYFKKNKKIEIVDNANDGEEGIKLIKENKYDVILLDLIMPLKDGFGVLDYLKDNIDLINDSVVLVFVENEAEKNTVVKQDPGKNTDWDITKVIKLEVSKGPAPTTEPTTEPTQPAEVTKDVVIDLKGEADAADTHVSITCNGTEIYNQTVTAGTKTITLPGQSGINTVVYSIVVNMSEGWETSVVFTN